MPEKIYLPGLVDRSFDNDPQLRQKVEESRTITFVISSEAKDRHRTVVNMKGWKLENYKKNPIVGYQHNVYGDNMCSPPNPDDVIGKSLVYLEETPTRILLMADVTFEKADLNPMAEKIFRKILAGTLNAASVGFLEVGKGRREETKNDKGEIVDATYFFEGQELVEWSVVNIPSNPEATKKSLVNHTKAGIGFLTRFGIKVSEIRKIANDILDAIEREESGTIEESASGSDPDSIIMSEKITKRKNATK